MIQDAPGACGVNIPIDTIVRLVNDYDNIRFVKAEAPPTFQKAKKIIEATGGKVTVFGGLNATFFYEELCSGVVGTMPAGEFPDVSLSGYMSCIPPAGTSRRARSSTGICRSYVWALCRAEWRWPCIRRSW